jgi:uncharacterized membrane protein YgcG
MRRYCKQCNSYEYEYSHTHCHRCNSQLHREEDSPDLFTPFLMGMAAEAIFDSSSSSSTSFDPTPSVPDTPSFDGGGGFSGGGGADGSW